MSLETDAGTVLVLAPDWRRPLEWLPTLAAYIVAAPLGGDTCLALDARAVGLTGAQVGGLVERACDYVSEGRDFAEVLLAPGAEREQPQAVVRSAGELVERLGLSVPEVEQTWTSLFGHAQWAKALVDDLQGQVDKALFEAARPVNLDGEPLVTVRIPTFGSIDLLVERAIPSVLGGAYQNIELLVCSDGPQPHAREAVEQVKDPRVRYIEVPERPRYPTIPFSFWRVAGTSAVNRLIDEARGDLIAPLDHDDSFTTEHIPVLLEALRRDRADFAYGQAMTEEYNDTWSLVGHPQLQQGGIVHATVMYTRRLAHMRYDPEAWIWDDPGDWNLWRRIRADGRPDRLRADSGVRPLQGALLDRRAHDQRGRVGGHRHARPARVRQRRHVAGHRVPHRRGRRARRQHLQPCTPARQRPSARRRGPSIPGPRRGLGRGRHAARTPP